MEWDEESHNIYAKDDDFDQDFIRNGWNQTFSKKKDRTQEEMRMHKCCGARFCACNVRLKTDLEVVDEHFAQDRKDANKKNPNRNKKKFYKDALYNPMKFPPQRLLFSATLTNNPRKLAMLHIKLPLIVKVGNDSSSQLYQQQQKRKDGDEDGDGDNDYDIEVQEEGLSAPGRKYELPTTLTESICICDTENRPFYLLTVLAEATGAIKSGKGDHVNCLATEGSMCLIFSSSVETTHRVCRMLQLINNIDQSNSIIENNQNKNLKYFNGIVTEMSSSLSTTNRASTIKDAEDGKIKILVCTDQMARGIDLLNVKFVINYDPPKFPVTYIHRVGRTARAGRNGHCMTMLKFGQVGAFKKMKVEISSSSVLRKVKTTKEEPNKMLYSLYTKALSNLGKVLSQEGDKHKGDHSEAAIMAFLASGSNN